MFTLFENVQEVDIQRAVFRMVDGDNVTLDDAIQAYAEMMEVEISTVERIVYQ